MKTLKWGLLYTAAFLAAFVGSALLKMNSDPTHGKYNTRWDETVGKAYTDLPYGEGAANKFDLYVPADKSQDAYGLVVYLHAGGFTGGDKAEDAEMLEWLCSKGYVAAGINYTLFTEENPDASVYSQSEEIKAAMPYVVAAAENWATSSTGWPFPAAVQAGVLHCSMPTGMPIPRRFRSEWYLKQSVPAAFMWRIGASSASTKAQRPPQDCSA